MSPSEFKNSVISKIGDNRRTRDIYPDLLQHEANVQVQHEAQVNNLNQNGPQLIHNNQPVVQQNGVQNGVQHGVQQNGVQLN